MQLSEETRSHHPYFMHEMILEQPSALYTTLELCKRESPEIIPLWQGLDKIILTGCGTSYHAALATANILYSMFQRTEIDAVQSFELKRYYGLLNAKTLVLGFSHTGATKTTCDALSRARDVGTRTIGLTGAADSRITKLSDRSLVVGNGLEKSRAHTKSYTSSVLAAVYVGANYLDSEASSSSASLILEQLNEIPEYIHSTIKLNEKKVAELASSLGAKARKTFFIGAGPNTATALEAALKMKETSYAYSEGMEIEQFLHGPWVSLDKESLVVLLAPQGPSKERNIDLLNALAKLQVKTLAITDDRRVVELSTESIFIPDVKEELTPLVYIVPLQLYAYFVAVQVGVNPDFIHYDDPNYWDARQVIFPPGTH